ncbi:unnamed protein product [Tilletia controversa]|nr:unnamed protein product [Tilletia controversa]
MATMAEEPNSTPRPLPLTLTLTLTAFLASHPAAQPPKAVLPALYADLEPQRSSNPHAFAASLDKWHALLADSVLLAVQLGNNASPGGTHRLVLHADDAVQNSWSIRGLGRPLGLGTVIADLAARRQLVRLNDFLTSSQPLHSPAAETSSSSSSSAQTLGRLAARILTAPLWWSLSQIGIGGPSAADEDFDGTGLRGEGSAFWKKNVRGDWVLWRNVERIASAVLEAHYASAASPLDHLYSPELLRTHLLPKAQRILTASSSASSPTGITLSELDVRIILKHLSRDRKVALVDSSNEVIKFAPSQLAAGAIEKISETDRGVVQVRDAHTRLERQVAEVEARIADRDTRIRSALRAQPKQLAQAKTYLTSKKALEELLKRRLGALETMSSVLLKLEQASGDIEIMQAYNTSTSTLKALLSHPSLQLDKVEDTMAALSDALADQAEVDGVIRAGGEGVAGAAEIDEEELERELAALELESTKEREQEEQREKDGSEARARAPAQELADASAPTAPAPLPQVERAEGSAEASAEKETDGQTRTSEPVLQ